MDARLDEAIAVGHHAERPDCPHKLLKSRMTQKCRLRPAGCVGGGAGPADRDSLFPCLVVESQSLDFANVNLAPVVVHQRLPRTPLPGPGGLFTRRLFRQRLFRPDHVEPRQRVGRGGLRGDLLARSHAAPHDMLADVNLNRKLPSVIRPFGADGPITWGVAVLGLAPLLQDALGIAVALVGHDTLDLVGQQVAQQHRHGIQSLVEIQRADDGFKRIAQ